MFIDRKVTKTTRAPAERNVVRGDSHEQHPALVVEFGKRC